MLSISKPIVVEGKYDRERILSVAKATVVATDGFGIFKKDELTALLRRLAKKNGIIVMTDSDGAGLLIRNHIKSVLPRGTVTDIYIPEIHGKEKRKSAPSKEGLLGVEGMELKWLAETLAPFSDEGYSPAAYVTKTDFFMLGLSGGKNSCELRKRLAAELELPANLSCSSLIAAINLLIPQADFSAAVKKIFPEEQNG